MRLRQHAAKRLLWRLEGVVKGHDERVRHVLQYIPLSLGVLHLITSGHQLLAGTTSKPMQTSCICLPQVMF